MSQSNLAIITARGGSKRIPRKNIRLFCGKPIIAHSIDAAQKARCFRHVMVSTDDQEIADLSVQLGAEVPFMRSAKTADDFATTPDVLEEVINEYKKLGQEFENVCCIYPTAPFVNEHHLLKAFDLFQSSRAEAVVPVIKVSFPIQRALRIDSGELKMFNPEMFSARSQDLEPAYQDCGMFYWLKTKSLLDTLCLYPPHTHPYIMSEMEMQDIDNEEDWALAEFKYNYLKSPLTHRK